MDTLINKAWKLYNGSKFRCLHGSKNLIVKDKSKLSYDGWCVRYTDNGYGCGCLYGNGKWADIIPLTDKEIIEEAARRYPIGTKVKCLKGWSESDFEDGIITSPSELSDNSIWAKGTGYHYCLYRDGKWAEIINEEDSIKYLLAEAKMRYPKGTIFKTLSGGVKVESNGEPYYNTDHKCIYIKGMTVYNMNGSVWAGQWAEVVDELLDKVRKKYIGKTFHPAHIDDTETVSYKTGQYFDFEKNPSGRVGKDVIVLYDSNGEIARNKSGYVACAYFRGKWARIVDEKSTLLEEAKKKYPEGTMFKSLRFGTEFVSNGNFDFGENHPDTIYKSSEGTLFGVVFENGKWAKVVGKIENILEEAREKYPKGTKFIPVNTDHFLSRELPVVSKGKIKEMNGGVITGLGQGYVYRDGKWAEIVDNNKENLKETIDNLHNIKINLKTLLSDGRVKVPLDENDVYHLILTNRGCKVDLNLVSKDTVEIKLR